MPVSAQKVISELTAAGLLTTVEVPQFDREIEVGVEALLDRLVAEQRLTQYQAGKFLDGKSSDIHFGDYIVLQELGRGGMGTVLLARHRRMDREVAIKILPISALGSESAIARFFQEVKVAAQLTHPNIVHAYDAGEHHGFHYLVMEYVRGHDLGHVLEQLGSVPVNLAIDYIMQVAKGLEYAHRKGVVHRDIKPANLLLDDEGNVKILDMGLARLGTGIGGAEASMHLTTTGQVMGTVEYMSPEQAEDTRLADARSDIYSLGCTFYRLVTGRAPFARDTVVKTIIAHREAAIPGFASDRHPSLAPVESLFRSMVAKNPDDRIPNTTMLLQELRRLAGQLEFSDPDIIVNDGIEVVSSSGPLPSEFPTIQRGSNPSAAISNATASNLQEPQSTLPTGRPVQIPASSPASAVSDSNPYQAPIQQYAASAEHWPLQSASDPKLAGMKKHRGVRILVSGILALVFTSCYIGVLLGIVTWVYAHNDLTEMKQGLRDPAGQNLTQAGRILSIIACCLGAFWGVAIIRSFF